MGGILLASFACGLGCATLAMEKGYGVIGPFIVGFFFSIIGLITYAGLPDLKTRELLREITIWHSDSSGPETHNVRKRKVEPQ